MARRPGNDGTFPTGGNRSSDIPIRGASRAPLFANGALLVSLVVFGGAATQPVRAEACSCVDPSRDLVLRIESVEVDGVPQSDRTGYEWGPVILNAEGGNAITLVAMSDSQGVSIFEERYVAE